METLYKEYNIKRSLTLTIYNLWFPSRRLKNWSYANLDSCHNILKTSKSQSDFHSLNHKNNQQFSSLGGPDQGVAGPNE